MRQLVSVLCLPLGIALAADGWLDTTDAAELSSATGRLLAFGDFNADRRTDLLVRESGGARVYFATQTTYAKSEAICTVEVCGILRRR